MKKQQEMTQKDIEDRPKNISHKILTCIFMEFTLKIEFIFETEGDISFVIIYGSGSTGHA